MKFAVFVKQVTGAADLRGVRSPIEDGFFIVWEGVFQMMKTLKRRRILDGGGIGTGADGLRAILCGLALLAFFMGVMALSVASAAFAAMGGVL